MNIKNRIAEILTETKSSELVPYRKTIIPTLVKRLLNTYNPNELRTKAEIYSRSELEKFIRKEAKFDPLPAETEAVRAALAKL